MRIIDALSNMLSSVVLQERLNKMQTLTLPLLNGIHSSCGAQRDAERSKLITDHLELLCSVIRIVDFKDDPSPGGPAVSPPASPHQHPLLLYMSQISGVMNTVFDAYASDNSVMEQWCAIYKYVIRHTQAAFVSFVPELVQRLAHGYCQYGHSCFLYVATTCVGWFGSVYETEFVSLMHTLTTTTFNMLNGKTFDSMPHVVEDYFFFAVKYCKSCQVALSDESLVNNLMNAAISGLTIQQPDAGHAVLTFIEGMSELATSEKSNSAARHTVQAAFNRCGSAVIMVRCL